MEEVRKSCGTRKLYERCRVSSKLICALVRVVHLALEDRATRCRLGIHAFPASAYSISPFFAVTSIEVLTRPF